MGHTALRTPKVPGCGAPLAGDPWTNEAPVARRTRQKDPLADLRLNTIPEDTARVLRALAGARWLRPWYLAGGTALALYYAHRSSVDVDLFTEQREFDRNVLSRNLSSLGRWKTTASAAGTLYGELSGVKASFIAYPWFRPAHIGRAGYLRILEPDDIAVMKVLAIAQRGRRRDFVDLYAYCQYGHALGSLLRRVRAQCPDGAPDIAHLLRSLVYFADAESDPPVRLRQPVAWRTITRFFERGVRLLSRTRFGLVR